MIKHMNPTVLFSLTLLCLPAGDAFGQNWPHWRGPHANGLAPEANPPLEWTQEKNVKWKVPIPGESSATPIVWGDNVFIVSAVETDRVPENPPEPHPETRTVPPKRIIEYTVFCFDRNSGEVKWSDVSVAAAPHEGIHQTNTYAAGSPTTDGERLYVSFGSRGFFTYTLDGERLWDRDLGDARTRRGWGESVTPVIAGDHLLVNWDTEDDSFFYALDPATGETKWRQARDELTNWTTPLVLKRGGKTLVIVNGTNRVRCYELTTGDLVWECGGQTTNAIPSPVYDETTLYVMSGYRGASVFALPLVASGDITGTSQVRWEQHRGTPYVPSPILVDGRLYFTQGNSNVLTCLNAKTGKTIFGPQRIDDIANIYASPVAANGRIYLTGREGNTVVIKAGDTYEVLASNSVGEPVDGSPALVGTQLFLRSRKGLFCIEE